MIYITEIQARILSHIKATGEMVVNYTDIANTLELTSAKSAAVNIGVLKRHGLVTTREKKGVKHVQAVEGIEAADEDSAGNTLEAKKNKALKAFAPIKTPTDVTALTDASATDDMIDPAIIPPVTNELPASLDKEYQSLVKMVIDARCAPKISNRDVKLLLLEKLAALMEASISQELLSIRDVLLYLRGTD